VRPTLTCVEGVGMHRHSARLIRFAGGALVATAIAPWLGGAIAQAGVSKPAPPSGDPRAVSHSGNVTTCDAAGFPGDVQVGADSASSASASGFSAVVESNKQYVDITVIPDGMQIDGTIVKGGDGYNVYPGTALTALHAPLVGNPPKNVPTISHWFLCASEAPPPPDQIPPSVAFDDTCQGIDVSFTAGTDGTDFSVTPPESGTVTVHVGTTKTESYPADADHTTITVTWPDNEVPASHSWVEPDNCSSIPVPVTDPAVSFANACTTGISVTLTHLQVDDTTTDSVTFTVVTPSGNTRHVTVRADQIVKLAFKVKEDTTGTVTVSAPGLTKTAHSYAKNCTKVLGEKVVKTPKTPKPAVQGEQAQLPFTGMPTALAAALGGLLLAVGGGLSVLGRRREREVSAS
jgi:hypothetical protein